MAGHVERHQATIDREKRAAGRRWADRLGHRVVGEARERCPVDEGTLRASITHVVDADASTAKVVVGSPLPYAEYFHTGTGIHGPRGTPIVPVTAKALKFKWEPTTVSLTRNNKKGRTGLKNAKELPKERRDIYFRRSVKGIPADPFLADALRAVMGAITRTRR